ncbi:hypothetical protein KIN20_016444 [Parelaphostrongylus tenuis]|uniref:Uncharacterized protein n=1 Tax=Parelaphostrongylus tenuis TaxID=148309 RepID=A0AAD5MHF0_PARTN|nr:hypothetical protein KIN20_016444 [Parelaphostrongylus tenuis]
MWDRRGTPRDLFQRSNIWVIRPPACFALLLILFAFKKAVSLGIYIVNEEFLRRCSELEIHDDIASVAEICRLQIFAGLTISFIGISDQSVEEYTRTVINNGGRVQLFHDGGDHTS